MEKESQILTKESQQIQSRRNKARAGPDLSGGKYSVNPAIKKERKQGLVDIEPTGPFAYKPKEKDKDRKEAQSGKFSTTSRKKEVSDKRYVAVKEVQNEGDKKLNSKLTDKEKKQKAYFASKLNPKVREADAQQRDDRITENIYRKRHAFKAVRYKNPGLYTTFSAAKYQIGNIDQNSQDDTQTQENTANAIKDTGYLIANKGVKTIKPQRLFNPMEKTVKRKQTVEEQLDKMLQEKRNVRRFMHKRDDHFAGVFDTVKKIVSKKKVVARNNTVSLIIFFVVLTFTLSSLGSAGVLFKGVSDALGIYLTGLSPSSDFDMTDSENYFAKKELELQDILDDIESYYSGYDRYEIVCEDEIGHDEIKLMAYLSAVYEDYSLISVKDVLDTLFDEMYEVTTYVTEETEGDEVIKTFHMEVVKKDWESLMATRIQEDKEDIYTSYIDYGGGHQAFYSPFGGNYSKNITSYFGYRIHPIYKDERFHNGIDIAKPLGTPIESCSKGKVIESSYTETKGNFVVVEDKAGYRVHYLHLSQSNVSVGDEIEAGETIGLVGSTGLSTGAHLHLSITDSSGNYLNPIFLVQGGNKYE